MEANNKLIFKNTIYLYIREIVSLILTLYSSRLLLSQLGVDDFGLYGLIGSILTMFSSLRGLFSSSIQRFINIEKAKGGGETISKIFSIGVVIHALIALLFILVVEVSGVIIIPTLNIDNESITSAYWVLHLSVIATAITIMTTPYDSLIIANEKFNAFAAISILEAFLKLGIIFLLQYNPCAKVVFYSALLLIVSLLIRSINAIYCKYAFKKEAEFHLVNDRSLLKEMSIFAGWQFFGNFGYSIMHAGLNIVINFFGGVAVNAARTITYQVQTAVYKLSSNINISFQPQSMMLYAQGEMSNYFRTMILNTKASFAITMVVSLTIGAMAHPILFLWLDKVPQYTTEMVQAILVYIVIRSLHSPIDTFFKAAGQLKYYQICEFIILSINLPISWLILSIGFPFYSVFIIMAIMEVINLIVIILIAHIKLGFNSNLYIRSLLPRISFSLLLGIGLFVIFTNVLPSSYSFATLILSCLMILTISVVVVSATVFNRRERVSFFKAINQKVFIKRV